ncbi:MAG: hypothetical protein Q4D77_02440 [Peptostreptococcaceae bacterium]|nr:hypothetical protein [Peptostreptococcaceae bacterium]
MKKKAFKGSVGLFVIGAVFLALAVAVFGLFYLIQSKDFYIKQNRIYEGGKHGTMVVNIYDISEPIPTDQKDLTVYFVDTGDGILLLEAMSGDKEIEKILEDIPSLAEKPAQLVIESKPSNSSEVSQFLDSMNLSPEARASINSREYLSSYNIKSDLKVVLLIEALVLGIALLLIGLGIRRAGRNKRAYETLYTNYPELRNDLDLLRSGASYFDEKLGLALYKNHLLIFSYNVEVQDMLEIERINYILENIHQGNGLTHQRFVFEMFKKDGKKVKFYFKKAKTNVDESVYRLFRQIEEKFPSIVL